MYLSPPLLVCRYALAAILRVLSAELAAVLPERFSARTRKRLFDLLGSWGDDGGGLYQSGELAGYADYRREVDKFKTAQSLKMRESQDRMALDRDLADQVRRRLRTGLPSDGQASPGGAVCSERISEPAQLVLDLTGPIHAYSIFRASGSHLSVLCSLRVSASAHSSVLIERVWWPAVQVECIQWAATNAMAALLYGTAFDDTVKKMNGRVMVWIHGLFTGTSERVPLGGNYSPVDPRTPSPHMRTGSYAGMMASSVYGSTNTLPRSKSALGVGAPAMAARIGVARTALLNLLLTNTDMFHSCIDQCYSSDPAIADGYFGVLAEVRRHRFHSSAPFTGGIG